MARQAQCPGSIRSTDHSLPHNPDIAVADWVMVILQKDRAWFGFFLEFGSAGDGGDLLVFVNGGAVVEDGQLGVGGLFPVGIVLGGGEVDVVGLPDEWGKAHIDLRRGGFVEAAAFVVLTLQGKAIEHLDFVSTLEIEATVTATLAATRGHEGEEELDVEVAIAKGLIAHDPFLEGVALRIDLGIGEAVDTFAIIQNYGSGGWGFTH